MTPIEILTLLGAFAEPLAQMIGMAMADFHDENDEAQLMFKIQRAISDARARRKFGSSAPGPASPT